MEAPVATQVAQPFLHNYARGLGKLFAVVALVGIAVIVRDELSDGVDLYDRVANYGSFLFCAGGSYFFLKLDV